MRLAVFAFLALAAVAGWCGFILCTLYAGSSQYSKDLRYALSFYPYAERVHVHSQILTIRNMPVVGLNIVSFSLFGNDPKYCAGAISNARLMSVYYSGWTMRVYAATNVPTDVITTLRNLHVHVIIEDVTVGMQSRFNVALDLTVTRYSVFIAPPLNKKKNIFDW